MNNHMHVLYKLHVAMYTTIFIHEAAHIRPEKINSASMTTSIRNMIS